MTQKYYTFTKQAQAPDFDSGRNIRTEMLSNDIRNFRETGFTESIKYQEKNGRETTFSLYGLFSSNDVRISGTTDMQGRVRLQAEILAEGRFPRVLGKVKKVLEDLGYTQTREMADLKKAITTAERGIAESSEVLEKSEGEIEKLMKRL